MSHQGIESIKRTNRTDDTGKWFILYNPDYKDSIDNLINNKLITIYQVHIRPENKLPGFSHPRKANSRLATTTSYADTLK
eukprot:11738089-Ditylum_brightwellii.AAC.1